MRIAFLAFLILAAITPPASARQLTPAQVKQTRAGTAKIWAGLALAGAGVLVLPVTGVDKAGDRQHAAGAALIIGGTGLVVWGVRDRQRAANPHTGFGVGVGRSKSFFIRRAW